MSFSATVGLVILSIDLQTGEKYALQVKDFVGNYKIPSRSLFEEDTIQETVEDICNYYINLDIEWLNPSLLDVNNDDLVGVIVITFYTCIPLDTPLKRGKFVPIITLGNNNNLISKALRKYESSQ